ncbi:UNVERIFIED_ORG: hypothetical protein M2328_002732 [Rhodococcus erythropolis]
MKRTILTVLAAVAFVTGCSSAEAEPEPTPWQAYGDQLTDLKGSDCDAMFWTHECGEDAIAQVALITKTLRTLRDAEQTPDVISAVDLGDWLVSDYRRYFDLNCADADSFLVLNQCANRAVDLSDSFDKFVVAVARTESDAS